MKRLLATEFLMFHFVTATYFHFKLLNITKILHN